jgi:hypothetical protein
VRRLKERFETLTINFEDITVIILNCVAPCGEELMMVYDPFHLLCNFSSPNSLTFELKSKT